MEMKFEWDEKKNALNKQKHGISFENATRAFSDPNRLELFDKDHSLFEKRWGIIGLAEFKLIKVSFTERNGQIRIISVRKADKKEEEKYFYGYSKIHIHRK